MELIPICVLQEYLTTANLSMLRMCSRYFNMHIINKYRLIDNLVYDECLRLIKMCNQNWWDDTYKFLGGSGDINKLEYAYQLIASQWLLPHVKCKKLDKLYDNVLIGGAAFNKPNVIQWVMNKKKNVTISDDVLQHACHNKSYQILTIFIDHPKLWQNAIRCATFDIPLVQWLNTHGVTGKVNIFHHQLVNKNNLPLLQYCLRNGILDQSSAYFKCDVSRLFTDITDIDVLLFVIQLKISVGYDGMYNLVVDKSHHNIINWKNKYHYRYMGKYINTVFNNIDGKWSVVMKLKTFLRKELQCNPTISANRCHRYMLTYRNMKSIVSR